MKSNLLVTNKTHVLNFMKKDWGQICFLAAIAALLGIYHISTTVITSKDSIFYIEFAQSFANGFERALEDNRFGYPYMIYCVHGLSAFFFKSNSAYSWIYSAQATSLACRILTIIPLYFIGKKFVGKNNTFIGLFILLLLPYPAKHGANILRDWPFLMFFTFSLHLIIVGFERGRLLPFVISGFLCGMGFFIRPVILQVFVYTFIFVAFNFYSKKLQYHKIKSVISLMLISFVFIASVSLYQYKSGNAVPDKLSKLCNNKLEFESAPKHLPTGVDQNSLLDRFVKAGGEMNEKQFENFFWYFFPFAILGLIDNLKKEKQPKYVIRLFYSCFLILNISMLTVLHIKYGYIDRRHALASTLFLSFFLPIGLKIAGTYIEKVIKFKRIEAGTILMIIGLMICTPKLLRPIEYNKDHYLAAKDWIKKEIPQNASIMFNDSRLAFLSESKKAVFLKDIDESLETDYIVQKIQSVKGRDLQIKNFVLIKQHISKHDPEKAIVIYKKTI